MSQILIGFYVLASLLRLGSLAVSIRNEKALKVAGAIEYGEKNSRLMAISFVLFYTLTLAEAIWRGAQLTIYTTIGILLYIIAMGVLLLVWRELGKLWTVKLIISPNHIFNQSALYRWVRHPNYFLNVIPELIGLTLIMGAWIVLMIGLPLFLIILGIRIAQEERVMKEYFPDGATLSFPPRNPAH